jgi:hypothetical protein
VVSVPAAIPGREWHRPSRILELLLPKMQERGADHLELVLFLNLESLGCVSPDSRVVTVMQQSHDWAIVAFARSQLAGPVAARTPIWVPVATAR